MSHEQEKRNNSHTALRTTSHRRQRQRKGAITSLISSLISSHLAAAVYTCDEYDGAGSKQGAAGVDGELGGFVDRHRLDASTSHGHARVVLDQHHERTVCNVIHHQPARISALTHQQCQCQCQSIIFSVAQIAELLQRPQRRSSVTVQYQEMIAGIEMVQTVYRGDIW